MSDKKYKELFKDFMSRKRQRTEQEDAVTETAPQTATEQKAEPPVEEDPRLLYRFWKIWAASLYDTPPNPKKFSILAYEKYIFGHLSAGDFSPDNAKGSFGPFYENLETKSKLLLLQLEEAKKIQERLDAKLANPEESEDESSEDDSTQEDEITPVDAQVCVGLSNRNMAAYIFIFPPINGGADVTLEQVQDALKEKGVSYGISDSLVHDIVTQQAYLRFFAIANGLAPKQGVDGKIVDRVSRDSVVDYHENEKGIVDFKNLGLIQNIAKGDIICDIIPAIPGVDGMDVLGNVLPPEAVKEADVPAGTNTEVDAEGGHLIASIDGCITFEKGLFRVENKLVIPGNVDNSTGNIQFLGDVVIKGDVLNGFEVKASGNIQVGGMAEGAAIYSGGNILIGKGMNGDKRGILEASGDVICKFLENCTVHAGGDIRSDSIVWSDVFANQSVYALSGKGVIIGGNITAQNTVEAKSIGNKSSQKTQITLGYAPDKLERKKELEENIKTTENTLDMLKKNIRFLEKQIDSLPSDKKAILSQLKHQSQLYEQQNFKLVEELANLELEMSDFSHCHVLSETIFPVTSITIGYDSRTIDNYSVKCDVRMSEGEIVIGTKLT